MKWIQLRKWASASTHSAVSLIESRNGAKRCIVVDAVGQRIVPVNAKKLIGLHTRVVVTWLLHGMLSLMPKSSEMIPHKSRYFLCALQFHCSNYGMTIARKAEFDAIPSQHHANLLSTSLSSGESQTITNKMSLSRVIKHRYLFMKLFVEYTYHKAISLLLYTSPMHR